MASGVRSGFFRHLAERMTRSEALREAQLKFIKSSREPNRAAHPLFWAAFSITDED